LLAKAINVRRTAEPKYKLNESEVAKSRLPDRSNYQAIAVYDVAAAQFEQYAEATHTRVNSRQALNDAVVLRLGLGQADEPSRRRRTSTVLRREEAGADGADPPSPSPITTRRRRTGRTPEAAFGSMSLIDKNATADVQVMAHTLLARSMIKLNQGATRARVQAR